MVRHVHEHDPDVDSELEPLIGAFQLGRSVQEFCDTHPAGKMLVSKARNDLAEAINQWLKEDSPKSDKAEQAHFKARVCVELLNMIERAVISGREAEQVIGTIEANGQALDGFR